MVRTLFLVRHGQTDWNKQGRFQGHTDVPLNRRGRQQAAALADYLATAGIEVIYSSDLVRARETAQPLAQAAKIPLQTEGRLREMSFGRLEGLTAAQIEARYPDHFPAYRQDSVNTPPPGGESFQQMLQRVGRALEDLAAANEAKKVLVTAHGGSLKALLCYLLELDPHQRWRLILNNGSVTILRWQRRGAFLERLNDTSHLST